LDTGQPFAAASASLREKLVKTGAKVVRHARYAVFQMAEVAVPGELFEKILWLIDGPRRRLASVQDRTGRIRHHHERRASE